MATNWFISDPHFGHKNIIKYEGDKRPFTDTEHMDNVMIENFNNTVNEGDTVFWLGDMFFCNSKRIEYIVSRLKKTRNILIRGNHDKGISDTKFKRLGFDPHRMYLYENTIILTHEPISQVNMNRLIKDFNICCNVHGHTHSDETGLDGLSHVCISVENTDFKPVTVDWISRKRWKVSRYPNRRD
ncbi:metallophosphoesterase [Bacillus nakamurai]|uniref:metallophosphoesterase n=1 Tax=Bacillus nakamurai TaxID=1793963 RepID=UPI001E321B80|nr:metallophosphoesterase [Bacillus nakamurai]MCC9021718.1 metallophosphoesterase [Bacillus nakamurai]